MPTNAWAITNFTDASVLMLCEMQSFHPAVPAAPMRFNRTGG